MVYIIGIISIIVIICLVIIVTLKSQYHPTLLVSIQDEIGGLTSRF